MNGRDKKKTEGEFTPATILIVEDSPVQAELLRRALEEAGYSLLVARDGAEGLTLAKAHHPDAVVSDINMPVMDGYALCHAIRYDDALKDTPVILLTMLSDSRDVIHGLNAGADAYLTKPYNIPTLISRINSLLAYPPVPPPQQDQRKVEVRLAEQIHVVDVHGPRVLNLLISTYENAVLQNRELVATQQALEELNEHLEQKVLEQTDELRNSEQNYRTLADASPALIWAAGTDKLCNYFNQPWLKFTGRSLEQELGNGWAEGVHPDDLAQCLAAYTGAFDRREPFSLEYRLRRHDGEFCWVRNDGCPRHDSNGVFIGYLGYVMDITAHKQSEQALERANRALRTLSASNMTLVHAQSKDELLDAVCRLIVETGGYRMAWVGFAEQDEQKHVSVVAQYGHEAGYLAEAKISWANTELGLGPTGTAIRTGAVQVSQNILSSSAMALWRDAALKRGYQSSISLPLKSSTGILGALSIYASEPDAFNETEIKLLQELAADLSFGIESLRVRSERDRNAFDHEHHQEILRNSLEQSIQAIADTVEARDPYTAGHQCRVAELAAAIAQEMGLTEDRIHGLRLAATIHDLGKIKIPAEILSKPGKLTALEFSLIKMHPQAGYDILKDIEFPWPIADIVFQHHERLDGSGYPQGLKDGQLLPESRILAVADVVEAMASHRPYRAALGINAALEEIEIGSGSRYDPAVTNACLQLFREGKFAFPK